MLFRSAIVAADIDPEVRSVYVVIHSETYIPRRLLDTVGRELATLYGLREVHVVATHPESELHKIEPGELMQMFVSADSMTRGSLAGAKWEWDGYWLTIKLVANGKAALEELAPLIANSLREKFAAPVNIRIEAGAALEGQALLDHMDSLRLQMMESAPAAAAQKKPEAKSAAVQASETFYGKPFKGNPIPIWHRPKNPGS